MLEWISRKGRRALGRLNTMLHNMRPNVTIGRGSIVMPGARLYAQGGEIIIGRNCRIWPGAVIDTLRGSVRIGDDTSMNPYVMIYGQRGVVIGNGCRIAAHTVIVAGNHGMAPNLPIREQPVTGSGIVIGDDVWIASSVNVLDGCVIADGCVLAAGAVMTPRETEPMGIYAGVPARKVKSRRALPDGVRFQRGKRGGGQLDDGDPGD